MIAIFLSNSYNIDQSGGFCKHYINELYNLNFLLNWSSEIALFSSNIGLFFHCACSSIYRDEVVLVFHEFISWLRCKHTTSVVPIETIEL